MEQNMQYSHLDIYRNVKPEIDETIKKIDFLLGYQKTYFSVRREIKSVLFRLTDEKFLKKEYGMDWKSPQILNPKIRFN